jgi:hypothetical protein
MAFSRYSRTSILGLTKRFGTSTAIQSIRSGIDSGDIKIAKELTLQSDVRLDTLAGQHYGSAELWWVIAAASGIGWGLQVPPGTLIRIPNIDDVAKLF